MRIGVVSSYMLPHLGGLEIVGEQLFDRFHAAGHEVRWVSSRIPREAPARDEGRVRVRTLNVAYERFGLPLPLWGREGLRELRALARWADVLHVHGPLYPTTLAALATARTTGTPSVLLQHIQPSLYADRAVRLLHEASWSTVAKASRALADVTVAVTPSATHHLASIGARFETIINGVDTDRFHPVDDAGRRAARRSLGLSEEGLLLLFVGRLVERKGLEVLLEALPRLAPWRALIVGDGPRRDEIPTHHAVRWIPSLDPGRMPLVYQTADAVLFPARGEGLPLVVQEGMASGVPILARTDEIFAAPLHARGLLVPTDDVEGVTRGLLSLDPEARRRLGRAGRAWAESTWSWDTAVGSHLALLARLAAA